MSEATSTTMDATTHYLNDAVSRRLWQGQERRGVNEHGRAERVTLVKRSPVGSSEGDDGYMVQLHYATTGETPWVDASGIVARWPMITAGQLRKPTAPSLEVYHAVEAERARILAAWGEEMVSLGEADPHFMYMGSRQEWFERMVNNVESDSHE